MQLITALVTSPYLNLISGAILFVSGITESWRDFQEAESLRFGIHHGIVLFSLAQMLKTLPELFEGMEFIDKAGERR